MVFAGLAKNVGSIADSEVNVARELDADTATGTDAGTTGLRLRGPDLDKIKNDDWGERGDIDLREERVESFVSKGEIRSGLLLSIGDVDLF